MMELVDKLLMEEVPKRYWTGGGRLLTFALLNRCNCCYGGRRLFLKRYGAWVIIDDDWVARESQVWSPFDLWWLSGASFSPTSATLLPKWAFEDLSKKFPRGGGFRVPKTVEERVYLVAYWASLYMDVGTGEKP